MSSHYNFTPCSTYIIDEDKRNNFQDTSHKVSRKSLLCKSEEIGEIETVTEWLETCETCPEGRRQLYSAIMASSPIKIVGRIQGNDLCGVKVHLKHKTSAHCVTMKDPLSRKIERHN